MQNADVLVFEYEQQKLRLKAMGVVMCWRCL